MLALLDYEKKTAKNLIIKTLSETWPLSAKKLYNTLKKGHGLGVTYQAVHFALKELTQQSILLHQNKQYLLSPEWVEKITAFTAILTEKYLKHGLIKPKQLEELNFRNVAEAWGFILSNASTDFFGNSKIFYATLRKFFPIPVSPSQIEKIKNFCSTHEVVLLCESNNLIDKIVAKFLRNLGARVYLGVSSAKLSNVIVFKDSLLSVYILYSEKELSSFAKLPRNSYKSTAKMLKQDILTASSNFVSKNLKVKMVINRDPDVRANVLWFMRKMLPKETVSN